MRIKVRRLKTLLRLSGYRCRPGKGSHSVWIHPKLPDARLVLSGTDGQDAKAYQVVLARKGMRRLRGRSDSP